MQWRPPAADCEGVSFCILTSTTCPTGPISWIFLPFRRGDHDGQRAQVAAAHNGGGRRASAPQAAHAGKHALARQRPDLHEARRSRLLSSYRSQDVVQRSASPVLFGGEAMKVRPLLAMTLAVALIVAPVVAQQPGLLVIWNASSSVPVGLYLITQGSPRVGHLVVVRLPPAIAAFAARRRYLPASAYLLKPVAAVAGDLVCRFGDQVFVRRVLAGIAETADRDGNAMPAWQGCRTLQREEVFVLADHPASFDSRYFGPIDTASIAGRAILLWPHGAG